MLTIQTILKATRGSLLSTGAQVFSGVSTDSRTIVDTEIFLALKGERYDGHDFLAEALQRGAGAIVAESRKTELVFPVDSEKTIVLVDDTLMALHRIASHIRDSFKGHVIGVVGSNGKTTTKELLASILERRLNVLKTIGNLNNHIGMPLSITRCTEKTDVMVLEMGTNRPGDVKTLCEIARPDSAVITNIGHEHLEGLGTLDKVREAELEILPSVERVVANADDFFLMDGLRRSFSGDIITFGIECEDAEVMGTGIGFSHDGLRFVLMRRDGDIEIQTRLWGKVNAYNCLAAATMATVLGFSLEDIKAGIEGFEGVPMRYQVIRCDGATLINDVYNANPSSMRESLGELCRSAEESRSGRAFAVLGDMFELGADSIGHHESLGRWMSTLPLELFIAVGPLMAAAAASFSGKSLCVATPEQAGEYLFQMLAPGDVALIKGSRGMRMEKVVTTMNALRDGTMGKRHHTHAL